MGITTSPIALEAGEGEALWFLGALGTIKGSGAATGGTTMVSEWWAPRDHGSPLHVHHREHEWFYVLSGEVTFWVDGALLFDVTGVSTVPTMWLSWNVGGSASNITEPTAEIFLDDAAITPTGP